MFTDELMYGNAVAVVHDGPDDLHHVVGPAGRRGYDVVELLHPAVGWVGGVGGGRREPVVGREVGQVLADEDVDLLFQRGREQHPLAALGQLVEQLLDLGQEAHVGHLVGLVEHGDRHPVQPAVAALDEVLQPPGRRHEHLGAAPQRGRLLGDRHPSDNGRQPQMDRRRIRSEGIGDLLRESLESSGVDTSLVKTSARPTGIAYITVTPDGENSIVVSPGANADVSPSDVDALSFDGVSVLTCSLEVPLETVIHAIDVAAQAGVRYSLTNPQAYVDSNLVGFLNVLEACRQAQVAHLVYASSSSVYGGNEKLPFAESDNVDHPVSMYAASKKSNELMAHTYSHLYGLPTTGLRFFTVYGPRNRPDMMAHLVADHLRFGRKVSLYREGQMYRDWTYVGDIVKGVVAAADQPLGYEVINLGGHEVITINNLIKLIEDVVGQQAEVRHGPPNPADMFTNWADVSKAGELLGWEPQYDMRAGVEKLVEWYNAEREWASQILTP